MEEPMSTTLTIPADVVPDVREALFSLMGDATEQIDGALISPGRELHPEWYETGRSQLERVFALLDIVERADSGGRHEVEVNLGEHGKTLLEAGEGYLPYLANQEQEADANDATRAEQGKPPSKKELVRRIAAFREFATLLATRVMEVD
jgi:hypothetical protein